MKKLISILLVAFMLMGILVACGNDSEKETSEGKEASEKEAVTLIGTWEYGAMNCSYTFNEDGTGKYTFSGTDMPFTYTDDGSKIVLQYENSDSPNEFEYTLEGNTLHIEDSYGSIVDYTRK